VKSGYFLGENDGFLNQTDTAPRKQTFFMWLKQSSTIPQITIKRWYKPFPNGWCCDPHIPTMDPPSFDLLKV